MFEAAVGHRGNIRLIYLALHPLFGLQLKPGTCDLLICGQRFFAIGIAPEEKTQNAAEDEQCYSSRQLNDPGDNCAVAPDAWIVVVAIEDDLVRKSSNVILRRLDQTKPKVGREISRSVVILRNSPIGRKEHNAGCVGKLVAALVPVVVKPNRVAEGVNRGFIAGQKMPSVRSAGMTVDRQILSFRL